MPRLVVIAISIILPALVAFLYLAPKPESSNDVLKLLPLVNACINGTASVVLIMAYIAIRQGNRNLHQRFMIFALILSGFFLLGYVIYHATTPSTTFGGTGAIATFYYVVLISHVLLAIAIVPLVLITLTRALRSRFDKHKRIARITLPLWLYVSITGVLVYLMISPYYS